MCTCCSSEFGYLGFKRTCTIATSGYSKKSFYIKLFLSEICFDFIQINDKVKAVRPLDFLCQFSVEPAKQQTTSKSIFCLHRKSIVAAKTTTLILEEFHTQFVKLHIFWDEDAVVPCHTVIYRLYIEFS